MGLFHGQPVRYSMFKGQVRHVLFGPERYAQDKEFVTVGGHAEGGAKHVGGQAVPVEKLDIKKPSPAAKDIQAKSHRFEDIASGKHPVGVEGRGGKDLAEARRRGLYVNTINGTTFFSKDKARAAKLESYLKGGGAYGTPEFSRALGYTEKEIKEYEKFLKSQDDK